MDGISNQAAGRSWRFIVAVIDPYWQAFKPAAATIRITAESDRRIFNFYQPKEFRTCTPVSGFPTDFILNAGLEH